MKKLQQHPIPSLSELSSFTFSQIYPKLELERVHSTTTSSLTDLYHKDKDSEPTASTRVPRHSYNLRSQQQRNSQELQSLTSSNTNSKLLRHHAQPRLDTSSLSSSQPTIPSSLSLPFKITSRFETASLLSENPITISDSAANFSQVYSPSSIASNSIASKISQGLQHQILTNILSVLIQKLFVLLTKTLDTQYYLQDL